MPKEVHEKWGFGLAPPFPGTQASRLASIAFVRSMLDADFSFHPATDLEHLSVVKGLFNRIHRQDQWDWFTVMGQLGYPSGRLSKAIAEKIADLRTAIRDGEREAGIAAWTALRRLPTRQCLGIFQGQLAIPEDGGRGWIYILSTREIPDLLKVGMTTRTIEERVSEINRATGVAIPFGVRSCWRVKDTAATERLVHLELQAFRIRGDREFFRIDYGEARKRVGSLLMSKDLAVRTLEDLI